LGENLLGKRRKQVAKDLLILCYPFLILRVWNRISHLGAGVVTIFGNRLQELRRWLGGGLDEASELGALQGR
jgi:hypothetical protein